MVPLCSGRDHLFQEDPGDECPVSLSFRAFEPGRAGRDLSFYSQLQVSAGRHNPQSQHPDLYPDRGALCGCAGVF